MAPGVTVLLTRLSRLIWRRTTEEMLGLRPKEFVALAFLRERTPVSQQELGEILCIDPNNMVLLLNDLEQAGYALRRRDPDDRRRHQVEITDEGLLALEDAEEGIESMEGELLAGLSVTERRELRALLTKAFMSVTR
jgi:DNA-binding MarR family transcriptional regulator